MKIVVLTQAKEDLFDGYLFYERQQAGIGDYFFDSINADIESLLIHHGIRVYFGEVPKPVFPRGAASVPGQSVKAAACPP